MLAEIEEIYNGTGIVALGCMTNLQTPSRYWNKQKAKLKTMFSQLEDSDFNYDYGNKEAMLTHLQFKIGKTRSDLNELITDLGKKSKSYKR